MTAMGSVQTTTYGNLNVRLFDYKWVQMCGGLLECSDRLWVSVTLLMLTRHVCQMEMFVSSGTLSVTQSGGSYKQT
jgi:hypothetical protein